MERIDIEIRGVITLTSDLHVAAFGDHTPVLAPGKKDNTVATVKKRIASFKLAKRTGGEDEDEGQEGARTAYATYIPFVAGNSIRGRLRRIASAKIKTTLIEKGKALKPNAYYLLSNGSTSTQGSKGVYSILRHNQVRDDLFLGIFGAETDYVSRLTTPDVLPVLKETLELKMVPAEFESSAMPVEPYQLYNIFTITKKDDFLSQRDPLAAEVVGDYDNQYHEIAKKKIDNAAAKSAGEDVKKTDFDNIMSFEAVMAGTNLYFSVAARKVRPDQAGLLIQSIAEINLEKPLGGNVRYGLGRFAGSLELVVNGERKLNEIGITTSGVTYGQTALEFVAAANEALESYSGETLQAFADESDRLREAAAENKAKQAKAKGGKAGKAGKGAPAETEEESA